METQVSNELSTIVKESGIEITKAEAYALSFAPFMQKVTEVTDKAKEINYENPTPQDAILARKLRLELVPNRTGSEKKKDELKKSLLTEGNLIQSLHNVVKSTSEMTENALMEVEKFQERREAECKARVKEEREAELSQYVDNASMFPLGDMTQEAYEQLLNGQKLAYEARIEAENKAEEARIENERKQSLAKSREKLIAPVYSYFEVPAMQILGELSEDEFQEKLKLANEAKAESDAEQERIRIDNERLRKEAEEKELALKKEREEAERALAEERKKAEAEAKRIAEENEKKLAAERAEKLRIERELFEQREAERKAKEEEAARAEAEAAKGDKERYADLIKELEGIAGKYSFRSKKYKDAHASITEQLNTVINYAISKQ